MLRTFHVDLDEVYDLRGLVVGQHIRESVDRDSDLELVLRKPVSDRESPLAVYVVDNRVGCVGEQLPPPVLVLG